LPVFFSGTKKSKKKVIKKLLTHPLVWIFILALFLRTYRLSGLPPGFHIDEVKAGWNAYSLWLTGKDDWLHPFPLHYDTFGDQRPTGLFYTIVPSLAIFGLNEFAVRFTPALFGSLAVIAVYILVKEIRSIENCKLSGSARSRSAGKIENYASLMLAVSPWHISLSRASSEGIVATTLTLFGLVFLIKSLRTHQATHILLSAIFLILSYFFYHTSLLLAPLFTLIIIPWYFWSTSKHRFYIPSTLLLLLLFTASAAFILSPAARSRLGQVSIFTDPGIRVELDRLAFEEGPGHILPARIFHNKVVVFAGRFLDEYTRYLSSDFFLTPKVAKPVRYQTASRGLVMYIELVLWLAGLLAVAKNKFSFLPLLLLLAAPLPAAITTEDAPNLHRALLMSPFFSMIAAAGLVYIFSIRKVLGYLVVILLSLDFIYYTHMYIVHNPQRDEITLARNQGVKDLIRQLPDLAGRYSQILLTNRPDNLYPWYAFFTGRDPRLFNPRIAANKNTQFTIDGITFSQYRCPSEIIAVNKTPGILAVDAEGCPVYPNLKSIGSIQRSSGGYPYTLWSI
jgi:4-amino-4-deoxy-L-arabinose transferase-like glycosyltransferase